MNGLTEYTFYDGENITTVDRQRKYITMYERSGWSRSYDITFRQLLKSASDWDIKVDLNDSDEVIAEVATNIILANNAAEHNLDPFRYVPKTNKITDPRDKQSVDKFEKLLGKYSAEQIIGVMNVETKQALKEALMKVN